VVKDSKSSPLSHCRNPEHRDLFMAVVESTQRRSDLRARQTERAKELKALYDRHMGVLKDWPE
jgi:hypothetical protein